MPHTSVNGISLSGGKDREVDSIGMDGSVILARMQFG